MTDALNNLPPDQLPPINETENGNIARNEAEANPGFVEGIKRAAVGAYEKTVEAVKKRGRGRPPGAKNKGAKTEILDPDDYEPENEDNLGLPDGTPTDGPMVVSASLLRRCLSGVLKGVLAVPNSKLAAKAISKGKPESYASKLIADCAPTDEEIEGLSEFASILLKKYNVDTKFAPEVACCAVAAGIGLRYVAAFQTLNRYQDAGPEQA